MKKRSEITTEQNADNLKLWNALKAPPDGATKPISGGRLSGKTDINPQWRLEAMTRQFGPCGVGWRYEIVKLWTEEVTGGEITAFAEVNVYVKQGEDWSQPIPGIGGNMLVEKEKSGLHVNDECFKMAVTDALSVAFKALGVAADVYMGKFDSKYDKGGGKAGGGGRKKQLPKDEGLGKCPKCGTFLRRINRKDGSGWFLGCQAHPDCGYTANPPKEKKPEAAPKTTLVDEPGRGSVMVDAEEMCPRCGNHPIDPSGRCREEGGGQPSRELSQPTREEPEAEPEWRPQCCGRSMMPLAGFEGGAPFWSCPRCKKKRAMTEEERKRVGL